MDHFIKLAQHFYCDGETLPNLKQCHRNYDRICLVQTVMRRVIHKFNIFKKVKNNKKSETCRIIGNSLFNSENWFGALECYNKSICFATENSEHLAMGYGNGLRFHPYA